MAMKIYVLILLLGTIAAYAHLFAVFWPPQSPRRLS